MSRVIDIASRREKWHSAFEAGGLRISVSNHGRMYVEVDGKAVHLDLTDAVGMMGQVSEKYEQIAKL